MRPTGAGGFSAVAGAVEAACGCAGAGGVSAVFFGAAAADLTAASGIPCERRNVAECNQFTAMRSYREHKRTLKS